MTRESKIEGLQCQTMLYKKMGDPTNGAGVGMRAWFIVFE